jgi:UDP-N-acetyl-2-amino-2-deoxyglucuronate dehydrogenase
MIEEESAGRINTVLQLRLHPSLIELKKKLAAGSSSGKHDVRLTYITGRGEWYLVSWKGVIERSGGLATNIGIHFFDALMWLFGDVQECQVHVREPRRMAGYLELANARVQWLLSVNPSDLPFEPRPGGNLTHRSMTVDGEDVSFSTGFTDLHTRVYEEILAGNGFGVEDARASIELAYKIRQMPLSAVGEAAHPLVHRNPALP